MRLLLVILMLALLPLRGGAACALTMDISAAAMTSKQIAASAYPAMAGGHFDAEKSGLSSACPGHAKASHRPATHTHHTPACQHGGTCAACFTLFAAPSALHASGYLAAHPLPSANPAHFSSVSASPGLRPPIS